MAGVKAQAAVGPDLNVDVDAVAEFTRTEHIHLLYAGLPLRAGADRGFCLFRAGTVDHLIDGFAEDLIGGFQDEQADEDTGDRIQDRETQAGTADTDEGANG